MKNNTYSNSPTPEEVPLGKDKYHGANPAFTCGCFIIPPQVLERFAHDEKLSAEQRMAFSDAVNLEYEWRRFRMANAKLARLTRAVLPSAMRATTIPPAVSVFDCQNGNTLPGSPIISPETSANATAQRVFVETTKLAQFYQSFFDRHSVDNSGMALLSSIHFSVRYNNAYWNGSQMAYGDGDGHIFLDFTLANDVIAHELTHGVTQFSAALSYTNEAGGLNESMSDVFASMFRQWRFNQNVEQADWRIGKEIMGPGALARGITCLRDLANPKGNHCLSPQPDTFARYQPGMDPHESSGIPNHAFYISAMAIRGKSWETIGKVWYHALTDFAPSPNLKMKTFANRTRKLASTLFSDRPEVKTAVDEAWKKVGL